MLILDADDIDVTGILAVFWRDSALMHRKAATKRIKKECSC